MTTLCPNCFKHMNVTVTYEPRGAAITRIEWHKCTNPDCLYEYQTQSHVERKGGESIDKPISGDIKSPRNRSNKNRDSEKRQDRIYSLREADDDK